MTLGSKQLVDAIGSALREIARRHEGERPNGGCFDDIFLVLEEAGGSKERLKALGFPDISTDELAFILDTLEKDGTCGDFVTDQETLMRLARPITAWHDINSWTQGSISAGRFAYAS